MLDVLNISTLAFLGYIDYVSYKIPNVILGGWIVVLVLENIMTNSTSQITHTSLIASLLVAGSYFPLNHIVKCNAGDFKLYGVLTLSKGLDDSLIIILISSLISFFPIAGGKEKVPMAFMTFFGYIAFIILRDGRLL